MIRGFHLCGAVLVLTYTSFAQPVASIELSNPPVENNILGVVRSTFFHRQVGRPDGTITHFRLGNTRLRDPWYGLLQKILR